MTELIGLNLLGSGLGIFVFDEDAPWCFAGPDGGDAGQVQRARGAGGERAAPAESGGGRQHRRRQDNDVHTTAAARRHRGGGSR